MGLMNVFDIAGSAMSAQGIRLNTVSSNLANAESVSSSVGETYRARQPVFAVLKNQYQNNGFGLDNFGQGLSAGQGVEVRGIVESAGELPRRYEPKHPMADDEGYVTYPNVNVVEEMANMISASRSFQTNVEIMDSAKKMLSQLLTLGK